MGVAQSHVALSPMSCDKEACEMLPSPTTKVSANDKQTPLSTSEWASMGDILPLEDFDYTAVEPLRIYKFRPKYFLTMGLQKTSINDIIHIDRTYPSRLLARRAIVDQYPGALGSIPTASATAMVHELYEYLLQIYLPQRYPSIFHIDASSHTLSNRITGDILPLSAPTSAYSALLTLNRTVDEDFMMLLPSPDGDGYSVQAFSWAYPVGFDPQSKLGLKLRDAHAPVPGYREKIERSMDRYFAALEPGDIRYRVNWALATNNNLCERGEYHLYEGQEPTETETEIDVQACYVRCEIQTLFALPKTGGRVLSVHLYLYPLAEIKDAGLGAEMAAAVDGFRMGNVPGFYRYKRAVVWGEMVKEFLTS